MVSRGFSIFPSVTPAYTAFSVEQCRDFATEFRGMQQRFFGGGQRNARPVVMEPSLVFVPVFW